MSWAEFSALLSNLPAESQLARTISVRTAQGNELKLLSSGALKLRDEWLTWLNSQRAGMEKRADGEQLQQMFKSMFYEGK